MKNLHLSAILVLFVLSCGCGPGNNLPQVPQEEAWLPARISSDTIIFRNGNHIKTGLHEIKYIDSMANGNHPPFIIVSGRECTECDANIALWVFSAADSVVAPQAMHKIAYPGGLNDYETGKQIAESRLFIGNCRGDNRESLMSFRKEHEGNQVTHETVYSLWVENNQLKDSVYDNVAYDIRTMFSRHCREIAGQDMGTEP